MKLLKFGRIELDKMSTNRISRSVSVLLTTSATPSPETSESLVCWVDRQIIQLLKETASHCLRLID